MVNLKQTDTAYRELLAVLREAFVAQGRAVARQLRVANRAEVIGRDIESESVNIALNLVRARMARSRFGNDLMMTLHGRLAGHFAHTATTWSHAQTEHVSSMR